MSRGLAWSFLLAAIVLVSSSQVLIKWRFHALGLSQSSNIEWLPAIRQIVRDPGLWLGGFSIVFGALCWYVAMIKLPVSIMLPTAAVMAPMVAIGAFFFLGESMTLGKFAAILMIATGVVLLGMQQQ